MDSWAAEDTRIFGELRFTHTHTNTTCLDKILTHNYNNVPKTTTTTSARCNGKNVSTSYLFCFSRAGRQRGDKGSKESAAKTSERGMAGVWKQQQQIQWGHTSAHFFTIYVVVVIDISTCICIYIQAQACMHVCVCVLTYLKTCQQS